MRKIYISGLFLILVLSTLPFACIFVRTNIHTNQKMGETGVKKFKLENGMTVLIVENPDSKVVTLDVWVNTGSAMEPKEINGVSHFLEHMLFKGTATRVAGEVDREIENVGGVWNAATSVEFTHYYLTIATQFVDTAINTLSDVIANASIDAKEVERERQVILEEYHRQQDDPDQFLMTEVFWNSFEKSPTRWPVLGVPDTINSISREKLYHYYTGRYAPSNMALVVVGGVKAKDILPMIQEKFGGLQRPLSVANVSEEKTVRRKGYIAEYKKPVKEAYLVLTFAAPDLSTPYEIYAADLLSYILGEGRSSRLYERVKEKKNLVSNIASSFPTHRNDGIFVIFATFDYAKKEQVIKAILEEVQNLCNERVGNDELEKAKRMLTNHFIFSQETTSGRSSEIGFYYTLTGDTKFEEEYLGKIKSVTAEDIRKAADSYLVPAGANIFIVRPE